MVGKLHLDAVVRRLDGATARIDNPFGIPITLVARKMSSIEADGIEELLRFASLEGTLRDLPDMGKGRPGSPRSGAAQPVRSPPSCSRPTFTRARESPWAPSWMRAGSWCRRPSATTSVAACACSRRTWTGTSSRARRRPEAAAPRDLLPGQRDIPMSPRQRAAMLRDGLSRLHETAADNARTGPVGRVRSSRAARGSRSRALPRRAPRAWDVRRSTRCIQASGRTDGRDIQIGTVGGGNHFVEIQAVDELVDGATARSFGLEERRHDHGPCGLRRARTRGRRLQRARPPLHPAGVPHQAPRLLCAAGGGSTPTRPPSTSTRWERRELCVRESPLPGPHRVVRALREVLGRHVTSTLCMMPRTTSSGSPTGPRPRYLHRRARRPQGDRMARAGVLVHR